MRRLLAALVTPAGIITVGVLLVLWTWAVVGWELASKLGVLLAAVGAADLALGWGPRRTLSEEAWRTYHLQRARFWLWVLGLALALVALVGHFVGP